MQQRLGGYVRMEIPERREAVKELAANGHSTREIADVVGVHHSTVAEDLTVGNPTAAPTAGANSDDIDDDDVGNPTAPPAEKSQAAKEREEAEIEAARIQGRNLGT